MTPARVPQWRMRTVWTLSLFAVVCGLTLVSLLTVRLSVERQIRQGLERDLEHSLATYQNLTRQRDQMLAREAALLSDLPSLKALMASGDRETIRDGSGEFWHLSGLDLFALTNAEGRLYASFHRGDRFDEAAEREQIAACLGQAPAPCWLYAGGQLFVLASEPVTFGPVERNSRLGYLVVGYAVDSRVAHAVSEAAAAEVVFSAGGRIVASTLPEARGISLMQSSSREQRGDRLELGGERYLVTAVPLGAAGTSPVGLHVLKSYDQASRYLERLNAWMAALGVLAILLGALLAAAVSRTVTRPLENLVRGTRALGRGDFNYALGSDGALEVQELAGAFEHMRGQLKEKQGQLIEAERLATIGRMASSVSHDLRHHLSAVYANAEFMSLPRTSARERAALLDEAREAIEDMTDLLESLLLFGRSGSAMHRSPESVSSLIEKTVQTVRRHPDARDVAITLQLTAGTVAWVDARALGRALFNLLLNACQAARHGSRHPAVSVSVVDTEAAVTITVNDNGRGVPASIRHTLFQPFVSAGKENGTGLGLTLAQHVAQEHGGEIRLEEPDGIATRFTVLLYRQAWADLAANTAGSPTLAEARNPSVDQASL